MHLNQKGEACLTKLLVLLLQNKFCSNFFVENPTQARVVYVNYKYSVDLKVASVSETKGVLYALIIFLE